MATRTVGTVVRMVAAGTGEGAVLGWAQSRALRHDLPGLRPRDWVAAPAAGAALAWVAGLVVVFVAMGLAPARPVPVALAGVLGGLGMGLTVALVTGRFLVRLLERPTRRIQGD